jgi:pentatricopeptide repeat protein
MHANQASRLVSALQCASLSQSGEQAFTPIAACSLSALLDEVDSSEESVLAVLAHRTPHLLLLRSGLTKLVSKQSKATSYRKALAIYRLLPRLGLHADLPLFNAVLGACEAGRDTAQAKVLYTDIKAAGCEPDSITFKIMAATCAKGGDWQACVAVRKLALSLHKPLLALVFIVVYKKQVCMQWLPN